MRLRIERQDTDDFAIRYRERQTPPQPSSASGRRTAHFESARKRMGDGRIDFTGTVLHCDSWDLSDLITQQNRHSAVDIVHRVRWNILQRRTFPTFPSIPASPSHNRVSCLRRGFFPAMPSPPTNRRIGCLTGDSTL